MRFTFSLVIVFALALTTSCSKKPIEDVNQAALSDIIVGSWKVDAAKYRKEVGNGYVTFNGIATMGDVVFTTDSMDADITFFYKLPNVSDTIPPVPVNETLVGPYQIISEDDLVVNDVSSGAVTVKTVNRTSTSMTLIYEFKSGNISTNNRIRDIYTYSLTKQ